MRPWEGAVPRLAGILGYAPALVVPRAVSLAIVVAFTRVLETQEFGLYVLITVYGELLDAVLLGWSRLGILRFYARRAGGGLRSLLRSGLVLTLWGMAAGVLVGAGLAVSSGAPSAGLFLALLVVYFVGQGLLRFCLNLLRSQERRSLYVLLEVVRPCLGFLIAWLLVRWYGPRYAWLATGMFGTTAAFGLIVFTVMGRGLRADESDREVMVEVVRYSAPLVLVFLLTQLLRMSDRVLLNVFSSPTAVGIYSASYALARPPLDLLFNAVNLGAFPRLIRAYEAGGVPSAQRVLRGTVSVLMFLSIPSLTALILLAEPLADLLLGEAYRRDAPAIMRLVAVGAFLAALKTFVFDQIFHLERRSMPQSYTLMPAVALNVALNAVLIPSYGVVGAAWASVIGYGLATTLSALYAGRAFPVRWPLRESAWIACAALAMGVVISLVQAGPAPQRLLVSIPSGAIAYAAVCWRGRVLRFEDLESTPASGVRGGP